MIDKEQLYNVIENTMIAFSEEDVQEIKTDLQSALTLFSELKRVEMESVEPLFYPNMHEYTFRPEELVLRTNREELLANTKESENGYFKFAAVLQGGDQ